MGFWNRFNNKAAAHGSASSVTHFDMVTDKGNGFYNWNGNVYQSDIVRACVRPKVKAIGKLVLKHVRETVTAQGKKIEVNPEPYIRFLLEEPNPLMSMQKFLEKMAVQLILNKNAFALIIRDEMGMPTSIMPIACTSADAIYDNQGRLYLKFRMANNKTFTFAYTDIIHLREDYNENDIFGTQMMNSLAPLMEIVSTTDQGIVKAIRNSSIIRWLLKFNTSTRPEDLEKSAKQFADQFLSITNGAGVAAVNSSAEATQVSPNDYVPNASVMDRTTRRIYALFNTNEKIVFSSYSDAEWNSYYEAEIEPFAIDIQSELTRKLFSRKERGFGNRIIAEASNLSCASIQTKLGLVALVDRGAMTPNAWAATFNLPPQPGGDEPLRRLDTTTVKGGESE